MENNQQLPILESRRTFLGQCAALAGLGVVGCLGVLASGCEASTTAPTNTEPIVVDVSALDADGKTLVTSQRAPDGKPVLIVRQSAGGFLALSMRCTHESNQVNPPVNGVITCPFHGSQFDLTGAVKTGPAPTALQRYTTSFDATTNKLTVSFT
jgi:Rieske Fe-S protein